MIRIKRIYDAPSNEDGYRILVDRLWPRGLTKERAAIDLWLKAIAPTAELRTWFAHDPQKFKDFSAQYDEELRHNPDAAQLVELANRFDSVTLLYAAKDPAINHALVLQAFLQSKIESS